MRRPAQDSHRGRGVRNATLAIAGAFCVTVAALFSAAAAPPRAQAIFAAIDFTPVPGAVRQNREHLALRLAAAARSGARYAVLPELAVTGDLTTAGSRGDAYAEPIPGPTTDYFAQLARRLGLWVVVSVPEEDGNDEHFLTTVVLDDRGVIVSTYRKVMVRIGREDGLATRGNVLAIQDSFEDRGLRLGIVAGDDIVFGVPRLARQGADVILVTAGWSDGDVTDWSAVSRRLSATYAVDMVVANRRSSVGHPGGIFTRKGEWLQPRQGEPEAGTALALLSARDVAWRVESSLGLPAAVPLPSYEPIGPEVVELGRRLFFDPGLSGPGTVSCSTCHQPEKAFANGRAKGTGVHGRDTQHNVPTLLNVAFRPLLRWSGNSLSLDEFTRYPVRGFTEMNAHDLDQVAAYVRSRPDYVEAFRALLGVETIGFAHISQALAAYQRSLISGNSPFDRYLYGGDRTALDDSARRGLALFTGKADCARCHSIDGRQALLTDFRTHALGAGEAEGRYSEGLVQPAYHTPSLRNVALTAPYMHDGSLATLEEVVAFFDRGGGPVPDGQRVLSPLGLDAREKGDLVAFLRALTGDHEYDAQGRRLARAQAPAAPVR